MPKRVLRAVAVIVLVHNAENAVDAFGIGTLLAQAVLRLPGWLPALLNLALNKWILALAAVIIGIWAADAALRFSLRMEIDAGRWPIRWVEYRRRSVLRALRNPRTVGLLVDVRTELATLDRALTGPRINLPSIPCLDPDDPRIDDTIVYLQVIEGLSFDRLDAIRNRLRSMSSLKNVGRKGPMARVAWLGSTIARLLRR